MKSVSLFDLYENNHIRQQIRYRNFFREYNRIFEDEPYDAVYSSPGRTELCGNYTEKSGGVVLCAAVNLDTIAAARKTAGDMVIIHTKNLPQEWTDLTDLSIHQQRFGEASELIRGIAAGLVLRGYKVGGFNAYAETVISPESGLSSTAAFEVLIGNIFSDLYNDGKIDDMTIAQVGYEAENKYYGKPCGLFDRIISATGGISKIDFKNSNDTKITPIDFNFADTDYIICLTSTGVENATCFDEYRAVISEMNSIAEAFHTKRLIDITKEEVLSRMDYLRKMYGDRALLRAMHFYAENERVKEAVSALKSGDFDTYLRLVKESGESSIKMLQNIYPTGNTADQGIATALFLSEKFLNGTGISRVHGSGFKGSIQSYVPKGRIDEYIIMMESVFGLGCCHVVKVRKYGCVKVEIKWLNQ